MKHQILITDSNTAQRKQLKDLMLALNFEEDKIVEAEKGNEAMAYLSDFHFDLLVTESHLADMDGYELFKQIKEGTRTKQPWSHNARIACFAIASSGSPQDIIHMHQAGLKTVLIKPIRPNSLYESIEKLLKVKLHIKIDDILKLTGEANLAIVKKDFATTISLLWEATRIFLNKRVFLPKERPERKRVQARLIQVCTMLNKALPSPVSELYNHHSGTTSQDDVDQHWNLLEWIMNKNPTHLTRLVSDGAKLWGDDAAKKLTTVADFVIRTHGEDQAVLLALSQALNEEGYPEACNSLLSHFLLQGIAEMYSCNLDDLKKAGEGIAKDILENAMDTSQENVDRQVELGAQYIDGKEEKEGKKVLEFVKDKHAEDPAVLVQIGDCYLKNGMSKEATDLFRQAQEFDPEAKHIFNRLGISLRKEESQKQ